MRAGVVKVGMVAASLATSLFLVSSAVGLGPASVIPVASFSGASAPAQLPLGDRVPIGLTVGFTSEDPAGGPAPSLNEIRIELSRRVSLRIAGRPLCRERLLYKTPKVALEECEGSLVGGGTIVTDIPVSTGMFAEPPGTPPHTVRVQGGLRVFYGLTEGKPMLLGRIETGEPMPLVYVIPFAIERTAAGRTTLAAHKMRIRHGLCARGHPNCFADPYGVKDLYSRVASFQLSLRRVGRGRSGRGGFLSASCPPRSADSAASFALERIQLSYAEGGGSAAGAVEGVCR
jgi:hypothetical protein